MPRPGSDAWVAPARAPYTWITGRVHPDVTIGSSAFRARDGHPVPVRTYRPQRGGAAPLPVLVWFHGGGWVLGNTRAYDPICTAIARAAGVLVLSIDYRLAPEFRAPQAALDCIDRTATVDRHRHGASHHAQASGMPHYRVNVDPRNDGGSFTSLIPFTFFISSQTHEKQLRAPWVRTRNHEVALVWQALDALEVISHAKPRVRDGSAIHGPGDQPIRGCGEVLAAYLNARKRRLHIVQCDRCPERSGRRRRRSFLPGRIHPWPATDNQNDPEEHQSPQCGYPGSVVLRPHLLLYTRNAKSARPRVNLRDLADEPAATGHPA